MNIFARLLWTLRVQGVNFVFGVGLAVTGVYGLYGYKPLREDAAFEYPLPYELFFLASLFLGIAWALRAVLKAGRP